MDQHPLFDDLYRPTVEPITVPFQPSSETSRAGAKRVEKIAGRQCQELAEAYRIKGPMTDHEAAEWLGWERTTVIPRRHQLIHAGQVEKTGTRTNPASGVSNAVYGLKK